jgi:hypothetical protein
MAETEPIESQWYQHRDKGYRFQVLAVDPDADTIDIQHFDGDVEEIDFDQWAELDIEPIEAPEDWTGPMDDLEVDDLGYTETDMDPRDWEEPLEERGRPDHEGEPEGD